MFAEGSDLADFLEKNKGRVGRVSIDSDTCKSAPGLYSGEEHTGRIVSSVLESGETIAQDFTDVRPVLLDEVRAVAKDSWLLVVSLSAKLDRRVLTTHDELITEVIDKE